MKEREITEIYPKYRKLCYSLAYCILSSRDAAEACAEDALLHTKESVTEEGKAIPSVLILRSARELALERLPSAPAHERRSELALALDEMKEAVPSACQLDTTLKDSSPKDVINAFLASLKKRTRKIFVRRYWYVSPISDIAKDLHLPEEKICSALARARKKLRWHLEKNGGRYTDEKKLIISLALARDSYIDEADPTKEASRRVRSHTLKGLTAACVCTLITALNLWLFLPLMPEVADISMYEGSEYYDVIEKINSFRTKYPEYKNNYLRIVNSAYKILNGEMRSSNVYVSYQTYSSAYHETAESRGNGITKGNILQKNDKYAFRLTADLKIEIYALAGENSSRIKTLSVEPPKGYTLNLKYTSFYTMYLSEDGNTLTVLLPCYLTENERLHSHIFVSKINVSNPESIEDSSAFNADGFIIKGYYKDSFVRDEKLYLVSQFYPRADFSDPNNFLPKYSSFGHEEFIIPNTNDIQSNQMYCTITSVCRLDLETLALEDVYSSFIYSMNIAVGEDSIFISYAYKKTDEGKDYKKTCDMTDIAAVSHSDDRLYLKGVYSVEGTFGFDSYALDEKDGILRVVTETDDIGYEKKTSWLGVSRYTLNLLDKSISLYCIDTESGRVVASLEKFIRQQQEEKPYLTPGLWTVRFEGDRVYVEGAHLSGKGNILYTAYMSDLTNLTYTASEPKRYEFPCAMYDFGDDLILGVGSMSVTPGPIKVEIYQKTTDGKINVLSASEGKYYKGIRIHLSTLVDRESYLVGFVSSGESYDSMHYVLLHFNGESFEEIFVSEDINKEKTELYTDEIYDGVRSFIQGGYLYIFCESGLVTEKLPE